MCAHKINFSEHQCTSRASFASTKQLVGYTCCSENLSMKVSKPPPLRTFIPWYFSGSDFGCAFSGRMYRIYFFSMSKIVSMVLDSPILLFSKKRDLATHDSRCVAGQRYNIP